MEIFSSWRFEPISALITFIAAPLAIYLGRLLVRRLKEIAAYCLEGLLYWMSRAVMRSLAGALTLRRYCHLQLAGQNRYLHVPSSTDVKLDIDQVFVTLTLEQQGTGSRGFNHSDLFTIGNRIRIVGDPGSGKSSLIKRLFRDACIRAIRSPSRSKLPILLELKTLSFPRPISGAALGDFLLERLQADAERSAVYQMAECFDSYVKGEGLLVLLDGLDEVSTKHYPSVQGAIIALSQRLNELSDQNTIVLTMRTQFHAQIKDSFRETFGPALFLRPFTPSDIYEFLRLWPFAQNGQNNIARIYQELTERPTLREMCRNPLVLAMYVAEDQAAGHVEAPESRTQFYAKVTDELLIRRRLQQTGPMLSITKLREQRQRILGRLAYEHLLDASQAANSLEWSAAIEIIRDTLSCSVDEAGAMFDELAKETGIVTEERPRQSIRFIHLTFCEFLAGYETVHGQTDGWGELLSAHEVLKAGAVLGAQSRLLEVIPFAAGLLPRVRRSDAIGDIVKVGDGRLLARCFLETKLYEHPSWPEWVAQERARLCSTPEQEWGEEWLQELYLFNIVVRDANRGAAHVPVAGGRVDLGQFFNSLVLIQRGSLERILAAFASQDAAAVFGLAEVSGVDLAAVFPAVIVENLDQPPFAALVLEYARRDSARPELWAALFAEAALRSRVVGNWMRGQEVPEAWVAVSEATPRVKRWYQKSLVARSLVTEALTVALGSSEQIRASSWEATRVLRSCSAPGSFCIGMWGQAIMGRAVVLSALALILAIVLVPIHVLGGPRGWMFQTALYPVSAFLLPVNLIGTLVSLLVSPFLGASSMRTVARAATHLLLVGPGAILLYVSVCRVVALRTAYSAILDVPTEEKRGWASAFVSAFLMTEVGSRGMDNGGKRYPGWVRLSLRLIPTDVVVAMRDLHAVRAARGRGGSLSTGSEEC